MFSVSDLLSVWFLCSFLVNKTLTLPVLPVSCAALGLSIRKPLTFLKSVFAFCIFPLNSLLISLPFSTPPLMKAEVFGFSDVQLNEIEKRKNSQLQVTSSN